VDSLSIFNANPMKIPFKVIETNYSMIARGGIPDSQAGGFWCCPQVALCAIFKLSVERE
jgi:hypothetical protein